MDQVVWEALDAVRSENALEVEPLQFLFEKLGLCDVFRQLKVVDHPLVVLLSFQAPDQHVVLAQDP